MLETTYSLVEFSSNRKAHLEEYVNLYNELQQIAATDAKEEAERALTIKQSSPQAITAVHRSWIPITTSAGGHDCR